MGYPSDETFEEARRDRRTPAQRTEQSLKQREQQRNFDGVSDDEAIRRSFLRTFTGRNVFPLNMYATDIAIEDIAHSLSNIGRYNGHTSKLYTVGQHSVMMAEYLLEKYGKEKLALSGLLHDAPEAYIGDMPTPLKRLFPQFVEAEDRIVAVMEARFKLDYPLDCPEIKEADMRLLATEARDLMGDPQDWSSLNGLVPFEKTIECWTPDHTEMMFLNAFYGLNN